MIHITCSFRLIPRIYYASCLVKVMLITTFAYTWCKPATLMTLGGGEAHKSFCLRSHHMAWMEDNRLMIWWCCAKCFFRVAGKTHRTTTITTTKLRLISLVISVAYVMTITQRAAADIHHMIDWLIVFSQHKKSADMITASRVFFVFFPGGTLVPEISHHHSVSLMALPVFWRQA